MARAIRAIASRLLALQDVFGWGDCFMDDWLWPSVLRDCAQSHKHQKHAPKYDLSRLSF